MNWFDALVYRKNWKIRIFRHLAFWAIEYTSNLIVLSADTEIKTSDIITRILIVPLVAMVTYFIIYYVIPSYSKDHNPIKLVLCILVSIAFVGWGIRYYRLFILYPLFDPSHVIQKSAWAYSHIFKEIFRWLPGISLAIAIKMMKNKTEIQQRTDQLIEEKKATELAFLKAQMHPHFLFNTLNTLYSYSLQKADKSEQVVLHLANLMRYILEECDHRVIPIEKEIKVIEDYFELKKLRHGTRLQIDCQIKLNGSNTYISPLVFLPIIENSFKHTLSSNRGLIHISVQIRSDRNFIYLFVENDIMPHEDNSSARGLGIANVKRQLNLLYGQRFALDIKNGNGRYSVNLKVPVLNKNF